MTFKNLPTKIKIIFFREQLRLKSVISLEPKFVSMKVYYKYTTLLQQCIQCK